MAQLDDFPFYRGRVAQAAILRALGVGPGDEVALQAFTCSAVPEGILAVGARPLYVDVGPGSCTMDPASLEARLTPRTRAIIVQHTFGIPADLPAIGAIAAARAIPLIEDCAHAIGSTIAGIEVGGFGQAAFYSFEASKPIFAGLGGSARVNDPELHRKMERLYPEYRPPSLAQQGRILAMFWAGRIAYHPSTFWTAQAWYRRAKRLRVLPAAYHDLHPEQNGPAPDFALRLGSAQRRRLQRGLAQLPAEIAHRRQTAAAYRDRISSSGVQHFQFPPTANPVYGRYPLLVDDRPALIGRASQSRVEVLDWYRTPVHPLTGSALEAVGYRLGSCPNAEAFTDRVISLPTGLRVTQRFIERAVTVFRPT